MGPVQHASDGLQPIEVGFDLAGDLELEVAVATGGDDFLRRLRRPIADPPGLIGRGDRIDQADGVARAWMPNDSAGSPSVGASSARQATPNSEPLTEPQLGMPKAQPACPSNALN